jgi:hypothetical protein
VGQPIGHFIAEHNRGGEVICWLIISVKYICSGYSLLPSLPPGAFTNHDKTD